MKHRERNELDENSHNLSAFTCFTQSSATVILMYFEASIKPHAWNSKPIFLPSMMSLMVKTDDNAHPAVISSQAEGEKKKGNPTCCMTFSHWCFIAALVMMMMP